MTDENNPDIAESVTNPVANTSTDEFIARRLGQTEAPVQEEPQVEETQESIEEVAQESIVEETETEEVNEQLPVEEEEETTNVLSQYNLDEMSEDEIKELGQKLGSKAVARYGELTAKRKAAEEKLAQLQRTMQEEKSNPLDVKKPIENNPYSNLENIEDLQGKAQEINDIISWAEDTLFESDGYAADDYVTEVDGKEVTKAQVRKSLLQARKARDTFLPDQLQKIQSVEQGRQLREAFDEKAKSELEWLSGEDNDTRKNYEAMLGDKRFIDLQNNVDPDISAQLPYIIAHAANSIYGRKLVQDTPSNVSITPPKTSASSAPIVSRTKKSQKALADLNSRFRDSGSKDAFIKYRTAQLSKQ